jgi:hypothetical protein
MSQLYIRVKTGFYTHRKTLRLRAAIGESALWVPPRLWAYAAENQPDGIFEDYTAEEIATFIGYVGDAKKMLQAMLQASFFDSNPLKIHDWDEHNGYHEKYSERAKKAAAARWAKEKSPIPPKEDIERGKRKEEQALLTDAPSIKASLPKAAIALVFEAWNEMAKSSKILPQCLVVSDKRRRLLEVRLRDSFFISNWQAAILKIPQSDFLKGNSERGWKASFDWFIQPDSVAKIMEGKYDTKTTQTRSKPNPRNAGVIVGPTDYGKAVPRFMRERAEREAAEKASMAGQVAANENHQSESNGST